MSQVEYVCPMHSEVKQMGPGSCPICGMALEPAEVSLEAEPDQTELEDMTNKLSDDLYYSDWLINWVLLAEKPT